MGKEEKEKTILLLGCGIQGVTAAYDLIRSRDVSTVVLGDIALGRIREVETKLASPKIKTLKLDIGDVEGLRKAMRGCDAVLNSSPYEFCLSVTQAAIAEKVPCVDLGGDTKVVRKQIHLDREARAAGITIIPDCGVSPGITNVMVGHGMAQMDTADSAWIRDGGLPQRPTPPLFYTKLFSIDVLLNEYTGKTTAVRDFKIVEVDSLTEVERVNLAEPVGRCEATHGMGMLSSLPWSFEGRIRNMDNKFVRYPGHIGFFQTLKTLGFLAPPSREFTKTLLDRYLSAQEKEDLYVLSVVMKETKNGNPVSLEYKLFDSYDAKTQLSAMARTTGFSASIAVQMLANGTILEKGVLPPETALPSTSFFEALRKRNIQVSFPS